jgi:hypothetical protein
MALIILFIGYLQIAQMTQIASNYRYSSGSSQRSVPCVPRRGKR